MRMAVALRAVGAPAAVLRAAARGPAAVREKAHLEPAQALRLEQVRGRRLAAVRAAHRPAHRGKSVMASTPIQDAATAQSWMPMAMTAILVVRQITIRVVTDRAAD